MLVLPQAATPPAILRKPVCRREGGRHRSRVRPGHGGVTGSRCLSTWIQPYLIPSPFSVSQTNTSPFLDEKICRGFPFLAAKRIYADPVVPTTVYLTGSVQSWHGGGATLGPLPSLVKGKALHLHPCAPPVDQPTRKSSKQGWWEPRVASPECGSSSAGLGFGTWLPFEPVWSSVTGTGEWATFPAVLRCPQRGSGQCTREP